MSDNKSETGAADRSRINMSEEYEVQYWSEKFGISADQLREAVDATGSSSADKVEEYLKGK